MHISVLKHPMANTKCLFNFLLTLTIFHANWLFLAAKGVLLSLGKGSFITQNRNEYMVGEQVEATFSRGHCDLTRGQVLNIESKYLGVTFD